VRVTEEAMERGKVETAENGDVEGGCECKHTGISGVSKIYRGTWRLLHSVAMASLIALTREVVMGTLGCILRKRRTVSSVSWGRLCEGRGG